MQFRRELTPGESLRSSPIMWPDATRYRSKHALCVRRVALPTIAAAAAPPPPPFCRCCCCCWASGSCCWIWSSCRSRPSAPITCTCTSWSSGHRALASGARMWRVIPAPHPGSATVLPARPLPLRDAGRQTRGHPTVFSAGHASCRDRAWRSDSCSACTDVRLHVPSLNEDASPLARAA